MPDVLDRLHASLRRRALLARFTALTRVLLAVGFIPPGLVKVLGRRFTQQGVETPVGFFFEAFYRASGWYWLAGATQVLAGLLMLVPRTAHLGALLFLPVIVNIVAITWSIDFAGTKLVTALMLLATLWLVAWDYDRWKGLWPHRLAPGARGSGCEVLASAGLFALGGVAAATVATALHLGNLGWSRYLATALALGGLGALLGLAVALHFGAMPAPDSRER